MSDASGLVTNFRRRAVLLGGVAAAGVGSAAWAVQPAPALSPSTPPIPSPPPSPLRDEALPTDAPHLVAQPPAFSTAGLGTSLPAGWMHQRLPKVERANDFAIVLEPPSVPVSGPAVSHDLAASVVQRGPRHVLQVRSSASASSLIARIDVDADTTTPWLLWRWRVSLALDGSDLRTKAGDDYAARLYVLFDLPLDRLSWGERLKIQAARALSGAEIPAAALCYVWGGTRQPTGTSGWNAYTDRLRMIVVDSPPDSIAGTWQPHARDLRRDWADAFGGPMPRIGGVGVGADTDNTGEAVDAWFGDLRFAATAPAHSPATSQTPTPSPMPATPAPAA